MREDIMEPEIVDSGVRIPEIVDVEYRGAHKLHLVFDDGRQGDLDLAETIERVPPYRELRDLDRFIAFGLVGGTRVWSSELDMAPDWLYEEMLRQNNARH
jgi:hypothetical protein